MLWSRKYFDKWEWYHKPISPMEESLLLPKHINGVINMVTEKFGIKFPHESWKVMNRYLYLIGDYKFLLQPSLLILPFRYLPKMSSAAKLWRENSVPEYLNKVSKFYRLDIVKQKTENLLENLQTLINLEGNLFANSLYTIMFAVPAEMFLKYAYKLLVNDKNDFNYHELLIGFPDVGIESDVELWKVSQEKNNDNREKLLDKWIHEYGYRIQDKDILYPTLGENRETINSLVALYSNSPSPEARIVNARNKRNLREIFVKSNLRLGFLTRRLFEKIKANAQEYAKVRNSRPYYYKGNFIIRKILIELGKRAKLSNPKKVFFLSFGELKNSLDNNMNLNSLIAEREKTYEERAEQTPKLEVNE